LRGLPGDSFGAPVLLRLERKPAKKERPHKADAWLTGLVCGATIRVRKRDNQDEKILTGRFWGFCPQFDPPGGDFGPI
jgi:hypothetical protein